MSASQQKLIPNIYAGLISEQGQKIVTVNGIMLPMRLDLRNHSPSGFEWGYEGSGPAQLALAILAFEYPDDIALKHYQDFKREVVAAWGAAKSFSLGSPFIRTWVEARKYDRS